MVRLYPNIVVQEQSHRFKIYVANRVSQILESTSSNDRSFVEGMKNPADICSRGVFNPTALLKTDNHERNWLSGPSFLYDTQESWFTQKMYCFDESDP